MAEKTTNIRIILDKIMRHPLLSDIPLETVVDYTIDFMRILGVPRMFHDKTQLIEVKNHRGRIPCDYYENIQVRDTKTCVPLRYATDTFHTSENAKLPADLTFTVQGDIIYTSMKDTVLEMSYRAIETDGEGLPIIPDNSNFFRALELYIKKQWFTILFDLGKITLASLQNTQQEYAWAVGACETEFIRPDLSRMEALANSWKTLLVRDNEFARSFRNDGAKEILRNHP